jgi:uncharacterized membrane protein SpoIIM required for sporulation/ABC-type transport system involved in multi-copper enzyme maturation permease subunit
MAASRARSIGPALWIARREVRDQFRDWRIIFPIVFLTAFFPYLMNFTAQQLVSFAESYGASIVGERMIPFLLMIVGFFPTSVSLVIALETFVGEKERGSIEPLLSSPITDWQLYLGKLLAATVPPLVGSFLGMSVYILGLSRQGMHLPEFGQLLQIFSLTVIQSIVMVSGAVVVSAQATSVRAANLLSSFIIIPMALLIQLESIVMFWANYATLWWLEFGLVVLAVLLVRVGLAHFHREELLGRELDVLNLKWGWRTFWREFRGGATSLWNWYPRSIWPALKAQWLPFLLAMGLVLGGFLIGREQIHRVIIPIQEISGAQVQGGIASLITAWPLFDFTPVLAILGQNVRALLVALVLGIFSFGIAGMLPEILTMGVAGYLMELFAGYGVDRVSYLAGFILPHGILEIPAMALATAAVLKMGATLATPDRGRTVGEAWLQSIACWLKVMVGVVIPMLFVAAMLEAWVTPRIAAFLFT